MSDQDFDVTAAPLGMPQYMRYRPDEDTTQAAAALQQILAAIDRKVKTSNHLNANQVMGDMVMPALLGLYDWAARSHRDLLGHMHDLAGYLSEGPDVDPESVSAILEGVLAVSDKVAGKLPKDDELLKDLAELRSAASEMLSSMEADTEEEEDDLFEPGEPTVPERPSKDEVVI